MFETWKTHKNTVCGVAFFPTLPNIPPGLYIDRVLNFQLTIPKNAANMSCFLGDF